MKYTTNYNLNLPELADQFNLKHQNDNTEKIDTQMKANADAVGAESRRATQKENNLSSAITSETSRATQKENAINSDLTSEKSTTQSHRNNTSNPHNVTATQVGLGNVDNKSFKTMAQALFDMEHPVGKKGRLIQWPWEEDPNTKYNNSLIKSTWKPVTEYDGKFFKIDSTKAVGTPTSESLPNIRGVCENVFLINKPEYCKGAISNKTGPRAAGNYGNITSGPEYSRGFSFDASKTYVKNESDDPNNWTTINNTAYKDPVKDKPVKVQPDNISIKVWERTK